MPRLPRPIAAAALALSLALAAHAADWKAAAQPNLLDLAAKAPALKVEELVAPVRSARCDNNYFIPNADAKGWTLIQVYYRAYGGPNTLVIMNTATGAVKQVPTERGFNFHLAPGVIAPNGKLYISILGARGRVQICVYDPKTNDLKLNAIKMPDDILGETHPLTLGLDGKIYAGGGHPSKAAAVVQIDPDTNTATSYSPLGPTHEPSDCWNYSMAADDRYIYVASGKVPWYLVAYDRQTGKAETLITTERVDGYISIGRAEGGCTAAVTKGIGAPTADRAFYWLYQGKAILKKDPKEAPPWPAPPAKAKPALPEKPEITLAAAVPGPKGECTLWYRLPQDKPKAAPAKAAKKPAAAEKGEGAGEEAIEPPPDDETMLAEGWKAFRYTVPIYPMDIYRIIETPDGRIVGTAGSYEGNFIYDPKTGKADHPGKIHLSHYATALLDGKLYMSGYPTSPLYCYDPDKPWTANTRVGGAKVLPETDPRSNPRLLARMEDSGCHKMYSGALAAGKLYFGGRWYRNGNHGGIGWYNPASGKTGGLWRDLSNYQVNFITPADEGRLIVISAHRVDDTVLGKPKPEQGALFFLDTATDKLTGEKLEPFPKIKGPGPIIGLSGARVLGWTENPDDPKSSILYGLDAVERRLLFRKDLPWPLPVKIGSNQTERWDFRLGPDGNIWTLVEDGKLLVKIDPADASLQVLGKLPSGGRLAFSGKDLYLSGDDNLRRIKGIVPAP
jgi:hypothetical protein